MIDDIVTALRESADCIEKERKLIEGLLSACRAANKTVRISGDGQGTLLPFEVWNDISLALRKFDE